MKEDTNNEIDLLLRRVSRRDGGFMRNEEAEQHLDADELNSYAQNALPAAARARYTEHLAECSRCRKLVTELSLSLGATTVAEVSTIPQPSALKKFLASLFSPMVLRYAAPALGVIVLAVVGIVVLQKQQGQSDFVAQMERKRSEPAAAVQPEASTTKPAPLAGQHDDNLHAETQPREERQARSGEVAESKVPADTGAGTQAPVAKDQRADTEAIAQERPAAAATPQPPAAAPKVASAETGAVQKSAETEAQKKEQEIRRKQPETVAVQTAKEREVSSERASEPVRDNFRRTDDKTAGGRTDSTANKAIPLRPLTSNERTAARARADEDKSKAETRTVAGRRFLKERGVWIDSAYDSSKEPTNVARGSEQFRALVADEPGIRTIAQQLDGEVIVVWKGHIYRIR